MALVFVLRFNGSLIYMCVSSSFQSLYYSASAASEKASNHGRDICRAHFALHFHLLLILTSSLWACQLSHSEVLAVLQKTLLKAVFQLPGLNSSLALLNA